MILTLVTSVTGLLISKNFAMTQPHILNIYKDFKSLDKNNYHGVIVGKVL